MSKTYGLPGLRIGWLACRDPELTETLLAAKEQILICGSTLDEEMAARVLGAPRRAILPRIRDAGRAATWRSSRDWFGGQETFEWVEPAAGVVGFPRPRPSVDARPRPLLRRAAAEHGTYVGPGHWFEQDRRCFRLGFGWPDDGQLRRGLDGLAAAARAAEPAG